jgi:hypothetical protein
MDRIKSLDSSFLLPNNFLLSLNVVEMYHSVPRNEAISTLVTLLVDAKFELFGIEPHEIGTLIDVILRSNQFSFDGSLFIQTKGLPIGNRLSGILADIFVSKIQIMTMSQFPTTQCFRYVDDFLLITNEENSAHCIKDAFNSNVSGLKFEIEIPDDNNPIAFLDFTLQIVDSKPIFSFYQKSCKKQLFVHSKSALPKSTFENMIGNEKDRILKRCTNLGTKMKSLNTFFHMLKNRGHDVRYRKSYKTASNSDKSAPKFFLNIPFSRVI